MLVAMSHLENNDIILHNMDLDLDTHVPPNWSCIEHLAKDMDSHKQIDMISLIHLILYTINIYLQNYSIYKEY